MDEEIIKVIAGQLRQPSGEHALEIGEKMNEGNRLINLHTIEALQVQTNDKVVEVGMGNGFFVKEILAKSSSVQYIGCDYSESMVQEASKLNEAFVQNGKAIFHHTTADVLPLEDEVADIVFTVNTIYFWEHPNKVLAEFFRVLKPSGKLIIALRPKADMEHYPTTKYGFSTFSHEELNELLTRNNFKVLELIENQEPDLDFFGQQMKVSNLILSVQKN